MTVMPKMKDDADNEISGAVFFKTAPLHFGLSKYGGYFGFEV